MLCIYDDRKRKKVPRGGEKHEKTIESKKPPLGMRDGFGKFGISE